MNAQVQGAPILAPDFLSAMDELDDALKEEGFTEDGPLGVFAKTQKKALLELARIVTAADIAFTQKFKDMQAFSEATEQHGQNELAKLRELFAGADKVLAMAKKGAENALAAQVNTREQTKQTISALAQQMATQLLDQTHGWLLIQQKARYRLGAWILAGVVSVSALAILMAGYEARAWQDAPATEALARCAATSFPVQIGSRAKLDRGCAVEELTPRSLTSIPESIRNWWFRGAPANTASASN